MRQSDQSVMSNRLLKSIPVQGPRSCVADCCGALRRRRPHRARSCKPEFCRWDRQAVVLILEGAARGGPQIGGACCTNCRVAQDCETFDRKFGAGGEIWHSFASAQRARLGLPSTKDENCFDEV